jgi:hypothetical protein
MISTYASKNASVFKNIHSAKYSSCINSNMLIRKSMQHTTNDSNYELCDSNYELCYSNYELCYSRRSVAFIIEKNIIETPIFIRIVFKIPFTPELPSNNDSEVKMLTTFDIFRIMKGVEINPDDPDDITKFMSSLVSQMSDAWSTHQTISNITLTEDMIHLNINTFLHDPRRLNILYMCILSDISYMIKLFNLEKFYDLSKQIDDIIDHEKILLITSNKNHDAQVMNDFNYGCFYCYQKEKFDMIDLE